MGKKVLYKLLKLKYYNQKTPIKGTTFSFVSIYSKKQPPGDTLKNSTKFTGRHLCQSLFLNKVAGIRPATFLKETLPLVFSYEFCEIFKNNCFFRTPLTAASVLIYFCKVQYGSNTAIYEICLKLCH